MQVIGNMLLVVAGVLIVTLARLQLTGMPGGDRGVGHAWALLMGHGALLVAMLLVTALVAAAGRLPTLSFVSGGRTLVALAFVAVSTGLAAAVAIEAPSGAPAPWSLDAALRLVPLGVPLLLAVSAGLLLNGDVGSASARAVSPILSTVTVLTIGMAALAAAPTLVARARTLQAVATRDPAALDQNQQWALQQIEQGDPATAFTSWLGYTREGNHPTIRARALARVMAVADWHTRVSAVLASPSAPEAFEFLAGNDVPDRRVFAAAVDEGIRQHVGLVRERIQRASHPSHLYEGLLVFEIDRVLRVATRYEGLGTDYAPAVRELRQAFTERTPYTHPEYRAVSLIEKWLRKR